MTSASAVEIQLRTGIPATEQAFYQIVILQPRSADAEALTGRLHVAPRIPDNAWNGYKGAWPRIGLSDDEEPTWEDAAWQ